MSSKSPGPPHHLTPQKQQLTAAPQASLGNICCSSGEYNHHHHHHHHQQQHPSSPDGELVVVTRTLSGGLSDGGSSRDSGYCVNTSDGASTCSSSTTDAAESEGGGVGYGVGGVAGGGGGGTLLVLEPKSLRSFTTNDEYLYAMREDLADWFSCLYKHTDMTADSFFPLLETGVLLCQHANKVQDFSQQRREQGETLEMRSYFIRSVPQGNVPYRENVKPQTFQSRDNVSNFIAWGKKLGIPEVLSFETDDLVLRKNEKNVILCLLEIARVGAKLGMLAPTLVQMEQEIDAELAGEEVKPKAQIKTCDMRSLDEMVRDLIGRCTCPVQFPMVKVGDGKYKIGDSRSLIFVRILRNHVMVRVGGGWDTLENYLNKHDPCQCNYRGHRASSLGPGGGNTPKTTASGGNNPRPATSSRSLFSSTENGSNPRATASANKILSPRRMSQPAVAVTAQAQAQAHAQAQAAANQMGGRNRSTSPKQPTRSKSPTLLISRHIGGGNQKPSFSVSNHRSVAESSKSFTTTTNNDGIQIYKGKSSNGGSGGGGGSGGVPSVSKSWSQSAGYGTPNNNRTPSSRNGSKSPSPCPSNTRLRSPSPLNASVSGPNQARPQQHQQHPHNKFVRASSSSTLLAAKPRGGGQGQVGSGGGGGGSREVKVGTPRSIKRATMNSKFGRADSAEEDDEYDNDDLDDEVYDDDDENDDDEEEEDGVNYRRWKAQGVHLPDLQFNCDDIEADSRHQSCDYYLPGSVSFDDSCDGPARSRSSLERVTESEAASSSELPGDSGRRSNTTTTTNNNNNSNNNMPLEKINTMTLTEFKSLLSTALSVPEEQQQQQQQLQQRKDRDNPNSFSSNKPPSSLSFASNNSNGGGITSTASTPGASETNKQQLNWDSLRDKARLVRDSISSSVNSRKPSLGSTTGNASPGMGRRSLPQSPDDDDGSRYNRVPYTDRNRPKTPQSVRRSGAINTTTTTANNAAVARPKTPTSAISRPKTPTSVGGRPKTPTSSISRPKTPSSSSSSSMHTQPQSRSRTPTGSLDRNTMMQRDEYKMARPKTPSQMKREAVAKVAGAISNWVESRNELDSGSGSGGGTAHTYNRGRPKTPVLSSSQKYSFDDNEEDDEIMGTLANNRVESLSVAASVRERPNTPSRIPKPSFTPRPATPKRPENNNIDDDVILNNNNNNNNHHHYSHSSSSSPPPPPVVETDRVRPSIPAKPPQSLSLSHQQQNSYGSPLNSAASTPDTEQHHFSSSSSSTRLSSSAHIPSSSSSTKAVSRSSHYQAAQSAPSTPGCVKENRSIISNTVGNGKSSYKDMYISKRATTPTQQLSSSSSISIPRSQPSRCVTPGPREKWSLGERSTNSTTGNQSRISNYQNNNTTTNSTAANSAAASSRRRRGSLSTEYVSASSPSSQANHQFVVTNEITFSDDEEINEMLKNAAMASAAEKQERKPRSASVDARRLVRQNASGARQKDVVVISRNGKGKHSVQVSKQNSTDSTNSDSVRSRGQSHGHSVVNRSHQAPVAASTAARFRSQTPDPSMFRRKLSSAKSVGSDDIDAKPSGNKSINRTEAWVDSTLTDTKRKLPPRPKRANTLGGDIPVSELAPRPLEEVIATILPDGRDEFSNVDTEALDAPAEDPEMYKKMEKLFEKYREMELRASVNEVPGGGKPGLKNKSTNPSSSGNRSVDACSKSSPSVASMKTSSGSLGSSSGRSSSHHNHHHHHHPLTTNSSSSSSSTQHKLISSGKSNNNSCVPSTTTTTTTGSSANGSTGGNSSSSSRRYSRSTTPTSAPKTFQQYSNNNNSSSSSTTTSRHQNKLLSVVNQQPDYHSNDLDLHNNQEHQNNNSSNPPSLKDIDAATAKNPTALISKIKEILRVRPRKEDEPNGKVRTRIPAPASLNKNRRSKSVSNLLDQVAEMTAKEKENNNKAGSYNRSNSNHSSTSSSSRRQSSEQHRSSSRRSATPELSKANSISSTNIAYSEFVFSEKEGEEEADSVVSASSSDYLTRTWSVQSDSNSSDSNNRCETPVPKLATPLTTGRSTFINRKLERTGRGLSHDKENALSNSQSSLSSRSALSTTEDEADYV